jgi:hypothetical protein
MNKEALLELLNDDDLGLLTLSDLEKQSPVNATWRVQYMSKYGDKIENLNMTFEFLDHALDMVRFLITFNSIVYMSEYNCDGFFTLGERYDFGQAFNLEKEFEIWKNKERI